MARLLQWHYSGTHLQAQALALVSVMLFLPALSTTPSAQAQTLTTLYSFKGPPDGGIPNAGVVRDAFGNLYGTTASGGSHHCWPGCGTVFKLDRSGKETVLHTFVYQDGADPERGLIADESGTIYGTTIGNASGWGTVFMLDATGRFRQIHEFTGRPGDGALPYGVLLRDPLGNLYGTTFFGGRSAGCSFNGCGTIFKIDVRGDETILYSFTGGADGGTPFEGLVSDTAGNLYGTTHSGGMLNLGTVFMLDGSGNETVLHSFTGGLDGQSPRGGLVRDANGNLYGTTYEGGASNFGTVFMVDAFGRETVLHSFTGAADGGYPVATLVRNTAGDIYGTAQAGGISENGTVFMLSADGKFKVLHSFTGSDGGTPRGGLILDSAGNLYGTTSYGGTYEWGTVFTITR